MPDHPAIAALPPEQRAQWEEAKRIFCTPPQWEDRDDAEIMGEVARRVKVLHDWEHIFTALGMDVPACVAEIETLGKQFATAAARSAQADEELLQAQADVADAERELFKMVDSVVSAAYAERPFDPQVQEWKEQVDEWRQHMPKE